MNQLKEILSRIVSGTLGVCLLIFFAFVFGVIFHIFFKAYKLGWGLV